MEFCHFDCRFRIYTKKKKIDQKLSKKDGKRSVKHPKYTEKYNYLFDPPLAARAGLWGMPVILATTLLWNPDLGNSTCKRSGG